jgi:dihydroflavonol-4-reductase
MTILVTGATGLLGNNIVRLLCQQQRSVRVLVRQKPPIPSLANLPLEFAQGDMRDTQALHSAMQHVTAVVHCAGHVHIGWSQTQEHYAINVEGTGAVASIAQAQNIRMVYISSVNALGIGQKNLEANEEHALPGITPCPYVTSKREAEHLLLNKVGEGLNAVIVCPGFMLGPWDWKPSSGRMMLEIIKNAPPLAPSGCFNVCDARDVAAGTLAALEHGQAGRRYILGGYNLDYFDLWRLFAKTAGTRPPFFRAGPLQRLIGGWSGDLWYKITGKEPDLNSASVSMSSLQHRFSSVRAIQELGYTIRPIEQTLQDTWKWFVEHGYNK